MSQQTDGWISQRIVRIQNKKPKRDENARKCCSLIFGFEAPAALRLLDGGNLTVSTSHFMKFSIFEIVGVHDTTRCSKSPASF